MPILLLAALAAAALAQPQAPIADSRDGKTYRAVKIGMQVWMAENLNYEAEGSVCYENKEENCAKYGRLYDWAAAMKVCPSGWHLPKNEEWEVLIYFAGGWMVAGEKLLAKSGWKYYDGEYNGTDDYGFNALPGGYSKPDGSFLSIEHEGRFWSANEVNADSAYSRDIIYSYGEFQYWYYSTKTYLQSVRCVRD